MAANFYNINAASDGSPPEDLAHLTKTLQENATQGFHQCANKPAQEPHEPAGEASSPPNDDSQMEDTIFQRLNKQLEAIEATRLRRKSLRAELKVAKRRWKALEKAYHRSRTVYDDAVDPFGRVKDTTLRHINFDLHTLREAADRDRQALENYSGQIRSLQDTIRTTQRALSRSQAEFEAIAVQHAPKDVSSHGKTDDQADISNAVLSHHTPPSSTQGDHPLLDRYLQRAADVGVFGERLAECNYEYWTAVSQREMRQDQDETLSVADEDFERYWQNEKESITRDLDESIREADELLEECRKEGLVLDADGPNEDETNDSSDPHTLNDEQRVERSRSLEAIVTKMPQSLFEDVEVIHADPSDDDSILQNKPRIVARVGSWMEDVRTENSGID